MKSGRISPVHINQLPAELEQFSTASILTYVNRKGKHEAIKLLAHLAEVVARMLLTHLPTV